MFMRFLGNVRARKSAGNAYLQDRRSLPRAREKRKKKRGQSTRRDSGIRVKTRELQAESVSRGGEIRARELDSTASIMHRTRSRSRPARGVVSSFFRGLAQAHRRRETEEKNERTKTRRTKRE